MRHSGCVWKEDPLQSTQLPPRPLTTWVSWDFWLTSSLYGLMQFAHHGSDSWWESTCPIWRKELHSRKHTKFSKGTRIFSKYHEPCHFVVTKLFVNKFCCDSLEILTDFLVREFSLSFGRKLWQISCLGMSTQANTAVYPKQAVFVQSTEDENVVSQVKVREGCYQ